MRVTWMNIKKLSADVILSAIAVPAAIWIVSFVFMAYETQGNVNNVIEDIREMKQDIKEIRNFLINRERIK